MKRLTWLFLIVTLTLQVQADVPEPKGVWEFNAADPSRATIGAPLELVGSVQEAAGLDARDGAIQIGQGSYYICTHGIAPNGGGAKVNEWTLLIDFSYPASSMSDPPNGYNDLFQTDPTNASDADWTINSSGAIGIGAVGYTSAFGYTTGPDTWYRLVVVVDNGVRHDVYVDGVEIFQGNEQGVDGRFSLAETLLLFCAGNNQDGDDAPIDVSTVAIWGTPLSADDVLTAGRAGDRFFVQKIASNPTPVDGSEDVLITTDLAWAPGEYAATHNVYFGPSWEDIDTAAPAALIAEALARDANSLAIERLDFGRTYYWRVDEVNGAPGFAIYEGNVWSFVTELLAYPIQGIVATSNTTSEAGQGPDRLVDGSGLNAADQHDDNTANMWAGAPNPDEPSYLRFDFDGVYKLYEMKVWNYNMQFEMFLGLGVKEATIEYTENGTGWTVLGDVELAQGSGSATYEANTIIPFGGVAASAVRMTIISNFSDSASMYGLSEVQILHIPVQASEPGPADGATNVAIDAALSWRPGREAVSHEVYLGTDPTAMASVATAAQPSYSPALDLDTTYSWQIVEVNNAEAVTAWASNVWSFTTQEYLVVDDFDDYDDVIETGTTIWQNWIDGIDDPTHGGAVVGNATSPFAEQTIVRSGQSLNLFYENGNASAISEADRTLTPAQNWTASGIKSLSLWFYGAAGNTGRLYVKINGTKIPYDGDAGDIGRASWQPFNIDLTTAGVNVSNVTVVTVGVDGTGSGVVYIDDIRLYAKTPEFIIPVQPDTTNLVAYYAFEGNANDSSGNGYNGAENGGPTYGVGHEGQAIALDGTDDYIVVAGVGIGDGEPRTISGWAKADTTTVTAWTDVFGFTGPSTDGMHFDIEAVGATGTTTLGYYGLHRHGWEQDIMPIDLEWHHLAASYDGATLGWYGDGQLIGSQAIDPAAVIPPGAVHMGKRQDNDNYFPGSVDEVRIYDVGLSAGEIAGLGGRTTLLHVPF